MTSILFTSDNHFYHTNVIRYSKRPFKTVEEMNEAMIANWNDTVGKDDLVYHLGDLFLTTDIHAIDLILGRLNGKIKLIRGNHDKWVSKLQSLKFRHKIESVKDYDTKSWKVYGEKHHIVMMHYPMRTWEKSHHGSIQLHGHCHGSLDKENRSMKRMDVGVDSEYGRYTPIPLDYITNTLYGRKEIFHHGD